MSEDVLSVPIICMIGYVACIFSFCWMVKVVVEECVVTERMARDIAWRQLVHTHTQAEYASHSNYAT